MTAPTTLPTTIPAIFILFFAPFWIKLVPLEDGGTEEVRTDGYVEEVEDEIVDMPLEDEW